MPLLVASSIPSTLRAFSRSRFLNRTLALQRLCLSTSASNDAENKTLEAKPVGAGKEEKLGLASALAVIDKRVWPIALSTLAGGTAVGVIFPVMPVFAQNLGLSSQDFGLIVSVVGFSRLVLNLPAAYLTDKYGRRATLIGGPILSSIGMASTATAQSLSELVSYRFLTGLGGSLQMTGAQMYLSDISTPENRARTMAPMGIAFATGATIGPVLGGYLSELYGFRTPFYFVASTIALVSVLNYRLLPETRKNIIDSAGGGSSSKSVQMELSQAISQWRPLLQDGNIRDVLVLHFTYWSVASGCGWTLLPLLASDVHGFSGSSLGGMFAMMSAIGIVGLGPAAYISDKFGRKSTILPAALLVSSSLACMPHATSPEMLLGFVSTYALGATLFNSNPSAFVADNTTEETRGQALAMLRSAGDAGLFVGAGSFGALAHATSPSVAFSVAAVALCSAGAKFVLGKR